MLLYNFLDRQPRQRIANTVSFPRFTRAEMLALTTPRIDSSQLTNWVRRGLLDVGRQYGEGDAKELRRLAEALEANEKLNTRRRYTGGDILQVMTLNALSQAGLPLDLSQEISEKVIERAVVVMKRGKPTDHVVIRVNMDTAGRYRTRKGDLAEFLDPAIGDEPDWFTIIDIDRIVSRFLREVLSDAGSAND